MTDVVVGTITQEVTTSGAGAPPDPVATTVSVPRMALVSDAGWRVIVPFAPVSSTVRNAAGRWVTLDRPGTEPLLEWNGRGLPTLDFDLKVGWPDHRPIETVLAQLSELARRPSKVTIVGWHGLAGGFWRVTELTIDTDYLDEANRVTQATVTMQLTAASDAKVQRGTFTTVTPGTLTNTPTNLVVYGPSTPASAKPELVEAAKKKGEAIDLNTMWRTVARWLGIDEVRKKLLAKGTVAGSAAVSHEWRPGETLAAFALRVTGDAANASLIARYNGLWVADQGADHWTTKLVLPPGMATV